MYITFYIETNLNYRELQEELGGEDGVTYLSLIYCKSTNYTYYLKIRFVKLMNGIANFCFKKISLFTEK